MNPQDPLPKTEADWKKQLTPQQYHVLREKGTEPPFTGKYHDSKMGSTSTSAMSPSVLSSGSKDSVPNGSPQEEGIYKCAACGNELFSSDTKFDSGTGWPSFYKPMPGDGVELKSDNSFGTERTEVVCKKCGGHLGHVFDDGPAPTGKRYCINSVCLDLEEKKMENGSKK